jgi:hypothetical protein
MSESGGTTIGLTDESKSTIEEVKPYFNEQLDASRFAMALAIEEGLEPGRSKNASTVWNVGSFDPDGEYRDLINALYPEVERPYKTIEYFINEGLTMIEKHIEDEKEFDPEKLI